MSSGVYTISNLENGKLYVGSAMNFQKRWNEHVRLLRNDKHHSRYLQRAWNKYGEAAFSFAIALVCPPTKKMLLFYEQQVIDQAKPEYNMSPTAGSSQGIRRTAAERARTSAALTPEVRGRIRATLMGHSVSEEAREKMRLKKLGTTQTPEHRAARIAGLLGHKISDETKKKIGAANAIHAAARSVLKTHCPKGHEYTEENTYHAARNSRSCRTCAREHMREKRAAKRAITVRADPA